MPEHAHADHAERFAPGLLDPSAPPPPGLARPQRYAVHRNNVTVGLIDALAAIYPAVQRITGTDFFRALARQHVRASPPTSPLLFEYGRDFPGCIDACPQAAHLPWLGDVARIERAWLDAYHAADAAPLALADLAAVDPARLAEAVLVPHPAARVVRSPYPAVSLFVMNRQPDGADAADAAEAPFVSDAAEDALITRPTFDVTVRVLPPGGAVLIGALMAGRPLGAAFTAAAAEAAEVAEATEGAPFDLAAHLRGIVDAGAFTHIHLPEPAA